MCTTQQVQSQLLEQESVPGGVAKPSACSVGWQCSVDIFMQLSKQNWFIRRRTALAIIQPITIDQ